MHVHECEEEVWRKSEFFFKGIITELYFWWTENS